MLAQDGRQWADLCTAHKARFDGAVGEGRAGSVLATWVKAQGGAKAAAARLCG